MDGVAVVFSGRHANDIKGRRYHELYPICGALKSTPLSRADVALGGTNATPTSNRRLNMMAVFNRA